MALPRPRLPAVAQRGAVWAVQRLAPVRELSAPLVARLRPAYAVVTPFGRGVLLTAVLAWLFGWRLGWVELFVIAAACVLVVLLSVLFVLGSAVVSADVELEPHRVFVGTPSAGRLIVRNDSRRRLLPLQVDLPVGSGTARFDVPSLGGHQEHDEIIVVPTHRRAVIAVGPASSVQGDPLGLLSRQVVLNKPIELFVHPAVVNLPTLGSGMLRDLEGVTTRDLSSSDLAFHTLRDYEPGDDRRYIHWRSSAKADKLLVRQFLDTRRSRVTIAVDADLASYRDEDEFETAMSVAGSIGLRCLRDDIDVTVVAAGHATSPKERQQLLDTLSRGESGGPELGLAPSATRAAMIATDTSLAVLVTGSTITFSDLRKGSSRFGPDVAPLAIRVESGAPAGVSVSGGLTVLALKQLEDLPRLLSAATS